MATNKQTNELTNQQLNDLFEREDAQFFSQIETKKQQTMLPIDDLTLATKCEFFLSTWKYFQFPPIRKSKYCEGISGKRMPGFFAYMQI